MEMAFVTVVVKHATVKDVLDQLEDLRNGTSIEVLAEGNIGVSDTDLTTLTNEVWLFDGDREGILSLVKDGDTSDHGRVLTDAELQALQTYGVCVEFKADHPSAEKYGSPVYAIYDAAAMAEASNYGFTVAKEGDFVASLNDTGDDASEQRWLRVRVPTWMNFAATL